MTPDTLQELKEEAASGEAETRLADRVSITAKIGGSKYE
jgi:hypothetical protein